MRLVLIGAGNVGWHLGQRLAECGHAPLQVYSRRQERAEALAGRIGSQPISRWEDLSPEADLYLLAVRDDAIDSVAEVLAKRLPDSALVAHTSGATPGKILAPHFEHWGVFYPLQTFSRAQALDFSAVPICIFAATEADENLLFLLAEKTSRFVRVINDEERALLHLAAVFVNNFTNAMYAAGFALAEEHGLDIDLLRPLLMETARKAKRQHPLEVQTGPAARNDQKTIERHLAFLRTGKPEYEEVYRLLTELIVQQQQPEQN